MDYKKIIKALNFLIPICYVAVGCLLLTDLFSGVDERMRILFGAIVIGYGIFRTYIAWRKTYKT